jgi:inner membrane transporter RhtA
MAVDDVRAPRAVAGSSRIPPHAYFAVSAIFHYLGPAFAVLLFARVDVLGVAWLRIASAAIVLTTWRRPWRVWRGTDHGTRRLLLTWGAVLAIMNCCFYLALDRLPLGTVAAIEFLPVIVLAAIGTRTPRNAAALVAAVSGVYLLTDVQLVAQPLGMAFAAANAVLFSLYIVLGHRVARSSTLNGMDGLALSMIVAAAVALPIGITGAAPALADPVALAAAAGVGICSSVIPYVSDQLALARLDRATYALMVSLLPATATVIGVIVLAQIPSPLEVLGVAAVVVGVGLHRERAGAGGHRDPRSERRHDDVDLGGELGGAGREQDAGVGVHPAPQPPGDRHPQGSPVDRDGARGADHGQRVGRLRRVHVPVLERQAPPADREQGQVDPGLSQVGHPGVHLGVTGEEHRSRALHHVPQGGRPGCAGSPCTPAVVLGVHGADPHPADRGAVPGPHLLDPGLDTVAQQPGRSGGGHDGRP